MELNGLLFPILPWKASLKKMILNFLLYKIKKMYYRASFSVWKKTVSLPYAVNNYFVRQSLRVNSAYCNDGKLSHSQSYRVVGADENISTVPSLVDILVQKSNTQFETTLVRGDNGIYVNFNKCMERNVKAYYFLMRPKKETPYYIRMDNPNYALQTNKVVEVDFDKYFEYCQTKVDNAHFTLVGVMLLAGVSLYTYAIWKEGGTSMSLYVTYALFFVGCSSLYPVRGLADALLFLTAITGPPLGVQFVRSLPPLSKADADFLVPLNAIGGPVWYFLWRSSFQSAFARGLCAVAYSAAHSAVYVMRHGRKQKPVPDPSLF